MSEDNVVVDRELLIPKLNDPRFEVYPDERGRYRWRLRAINGEIVATGEDHRDVTDAIRAIETVERIVLMTDGPEIVVQRKKGGDR